MMTTMKQEELSPLSNLIHTNKPTISSQETREQENSVDQLQVMLKQEVLKYKPRTGYFNQESDNAEHVDEGWRRKICEWCFEVVDHFRFDREVVAIALNYLERYAVTSAISSGKPISRRQFQLVAVTSLYIAIKLHGETDISEGPRRKLKIEAFIELSRGLFDIETLESTELCILNALDWHMNPPTTVRFVGCILRQMPEWSSCKSSKKYSSVASSIFEMSRYLTELSVCVSSFSVFRSSEVAYAAILCSIDALQESAPIPYQCKVQFLNNVLEVTTLLPENRQVHKARIMLKELCPSLFEQNHEQGLHRSRSLLHTMNNEAECGKASPVCVIDEAEEECSTARRKRGRFIEQGSS